MGAGVLCRAVLAVEKDKAGNKEEKKGKRRVAHLTTTEVASETTAWGGREA